MIEISDGVYIGEDELVFKASRSSGPGGQNVNKVSTRIVLLFDLANCPGLSETQKQQISKRLATRIDKSGIMRVMSQRFRSQKANRQAAVERLCELLKAALEIKPVRHRTKMPLHVHERRLEQKKRRSLLKQQRAGKGWVEGLAT